MKTVRFEYEGISPLSWSRVLQSERGPSEDHDAFDKRVWRERMWTNKQGEVVIPGVCFHRAIVASSAKLVQKVRGKTKHFKSYLDAGIMIPSDSPIGVMASDVECIALSVPSDGRKGGGSRVTRRFPHIPEWSGSAELIVLDEIIEANLGLVLNALEYAGKMNGLGRWRPERGGYGGRFELTEFVEV